jgi:nicotinate-nucleotide adenylyltransferase
MTLGLFGGTFDPIHRGHLDVAKAAREALQLDRLWLVPARVPPHRPTPHASAAHRFAMAAIAAGSEPGLQVSDIEMDTSGPSFTVETLDRIATFGIDLASVFLVTGADAFRDIPTWKAFPALLDRCHFIAVSRPGTPAPSLREVLPALAGRMLEAPWRMPARPSIFLVDVPTAPVSSTDVRRAIAAGSPLTPLVPDGVAAHILKHGLYGATAAVDIQPARNTA